MSSYYRIVLYMMNGEEFHFLIQVVDHQRLNTEQVSLMIKLSDIKTKSISTRHA